MDAHFAESAANDFLRKDAELLMNIEDLYRSALLNLMQRVSADCPVITVGPLTVRRPSELPPRAVVATERGVAPERSSLVEEKIPAA